MCPDVLWIVMAVELGTEYPVKVRRCDATDQTHVGRYSLAYFAEAMERMTVTHIHCPGCAETSTLREQLAEAERYRGLANEAGDAALARRVASPAAPMSEVHTEAMEWESCPRCGGPAGAPIITGKEEVTTPGSKTRIFDHRLDDKVMAALSLGKSKLPARYRLRLRLRGH
jgi:hypothetical protein